MAENDRVISPQQERAKLLAARSYESYRTITNTPASSLSSFPTLPNKRRTKPAHKVREWIGDSGIEVSWEHPRWRAKDGSRRWQFWANEDISADAMVVPLLIITFSCALADSVTLTTYSTFATSMTGNTVLLAVSALGASSKSPLFAAVSLAGFLIFGLITGQIGCLVGHRRRVWLLSIISAQILLLFAASLIVLPTPNGWFQPNGPHGWVYIFLIGCQGGIQVTQAGNAGARELPSAQMTTPYALLISDPSLFVSGKEMDVRSRNRRFIYCVVFWAGAFLGAAVARWGDLVIAAWAVIICKIAAGLWIALLGGEREEVIDDEDGEEDAFVTPQAQSTSGWSGWSGRGRVGTDSVGRRESRDERNTAM